MDHRLHSNPFAANPAGSENPPDAVPDKRRRPDQPRQLRIVVVTRRQPAGKAVPCHLFRIRGHDAAEHPGADILGVIPSDVGRPSRTEIYTPSLDRNCVPNPE